MIRASRASYKTQPGDGQGREIDTFDLLIIIIIIIIIVYY
uniref:RDD family protein n=1 Tax=Heterorhabditis bacteriophora TaxID=37862 RepID=A0A1I7X1T6_HETBA